MTKELIGKIVFILSGILLAYAWILVFAEPGIPHIGWVAYIGNVCYVIYGVLKFS